MYKFHSKRLGFRALTIKDVKQDYPDSLNNPNVNKYLETRHNFQTVESCKNFILECNENPSENLYGMFLLSNNEWIGNIKIGLIHWIYKTGSLSLVMFNNSYQGMGFGYEAVYSVTQFGFNNLGLEKIEAGVCRENKPSLAIFKKAGYQEEGLIRDSIVIEEKRATLILLGILPDELS